MKKTLAVIAVSIFVAACAGAQTQKCETCNPFKKTKPCPKQVAAKPVTKPAAKPQPKPEPVKEAPQRIKSEDLGTVAAVKDTGSGHQKLVFTTPIVFETNSDKLKTESYSPIKKIAAVLKKNPNASTTVEGYTDSIGDPAYNVELSERRAKAVAQVLIDEGVNPTKVSAKGYGAANPIADNKTREGRAKNRRVELDITNK